MRTSVIVPTYNASDRLGRTIKAVLAQQCRPAEIIVIDDGSTDATAQTCRNFGDSIIYHRTDNGGQQAARNLGASIATGDWLSLLDHDDLWDPEYLAEVDQFRRQSQHRCRLVQLPNSAGNRPIRNGDGTRQVPPTRPRRLLANTRHRTG